MKARLVRLLLGLMTLVLVGWAAGAIWRSVVGLDDVEIVRAVAAWRSPALTAIAQTVTWAGSAYLLVPLALLCCGWLARSGPSRQAIAIAVSVGGAMLISASVKLLVGRTRPPVEHLQAVTGLSFPSGHATQASAFWLSLALALRAHDPARPPARVTTALAIGIAAAVAASRVYLGVHYLSDVIAGLLLGSAWALFVASHVYERAIVSPSPGAC